MATLDERSAHIQALTDKVAALCAKHTTTGWRVGDTPLAASVDASADARILRIKGGDGRDFPIFEVNGSHGPDVNCWHMPEVPADVEEALTNF